jgi:hypothetical protein
MCTLTYVKRQDGYIVTANRDESPNRSADHLSQYNNKRGEHFYMAREPLHGGTNLVVGVKGRILVLLNGAFEAHAFGGSYKRSRGLMVLDSLEYPSIQEFVASYDFDGLEPFTMVEFFGKISEIRWDGKALHGATFDDTHHHIWASAQLYSREAIEKRQRWFRTFLEARKGEVEPEAIFEFHRSGGDGDMNNDMVMNRQNLVRTVSISQFAHTKERTFVSHLNLLNNSTYEISL